MTGRFMTEEEEKESNMMTTSIAWHCGDFFSSKLRESVGKQMRKLATWIRIVSN